MGDRWLNSDECAEYFGLRHTRAGKPNRRGFLERMAWQPGFPDPQVGPDGVPRWSLLQLDRWADGVRFGPSISQCYLYRHFDGEGVLLYVGISFNAILRLRGHRAIAPWWDQIRTVTIQPCASLEDALAAEMQAIRTEWPRHNKAGRGPDG